jgi:hypothetical protein
VVANAVAATAVIAVIAVIGRMRRLEKSFTVVSDRTDSPPGGPGR